MGVSKHCSSERSSQKRKDSGNIEAQIYQEVDIEGRSGYAKFDLFTSKMYEWSWRLFWSDVEVSFQNWRGTILKWSTCLQNPVIAIQAQNREWTPILKMEGPGRYFHPLCISPYFPFPFPTVCFFQTNCCQLNVWQDSERFENHLLRHMAMKDGGASQWVNAAVLFFQTLHFLKWRVTHTQCPTKSLVTEIPKH